MKVEGAAALLLERSSYLQQRGGPALAQVVDYTAGFCPSSVNRLSLVSLNSLELSMTGLRFSNVMEPADYSAFPGYDDDPSHRIWNLWGYIDGRDGALAVELALGRSGPDRSAPVS